MIACEINKNSFKYQTLKNMSGISEYSLDSFISAFQTKFGRMPELDELPKVNSEPYLKKILDVKEHSSINSVETNRVLEYTNTSTIEEANVQLNKVFKDLEVTLTPFQSFTSLEYKHRPSIYSKLKDPIDMETFNNEEKSRQIINKQLQKMQKLYGINIQGLDTDQITELGVPNASLVKGFIQNGTIYINTDNATLDTPIHELTHILLGSIRYSDPELFFSLVNQVEQLPRYEEYASQFPNRTRGDVNEEIFVQEFSKYLAGIPTLFNELDKTSMSKLMYEVFRNIDTLIDGDYSVKSLSKDIFGKSILELSETLQSDIINNKQVGSLDPGTIHRTLANVKEDLMKQNKLEERCDG